MRMWGLVLLLLAFGLTAALAQPAPEPEAVAFCSKLTEQPTHLGKMSPPAQALSPQNARDLHRNGQPLSAPRAAAVSGLQDPRRIGSYFLGLQVGRESGPGAKCYGLQPASFEGAEGEATSLVKERFRARSTRTADLGALSDLEVSRRQSSHVMVDLRATVRDMANAFLEEELDHTRQMLSRGYVRSRVERPSGRLAGLAVVTKWAWSSKRATLSA